MKTRGRPKTSDILTPREYEVLALLRQGLSNREIAGRLGISLAGAKFHVSEIIGKLGVTSREEAAAWTEERQRRWAMASSLSQLKAWSSGAAALLSPKVAAAALSVVLLGLVVAAGAGRLLPGGTSVGTPVLLRGQPLPDDCRVLLTSQCLDEAAQTFTSLEEAAEVASFYPALPAHLPEGFEPVIIKHSRPEWVDPQEVRKHCPACDPRFSHNDKIGVYYRDGEGGVLAVVQGFPGAIPWLFADETPEEQRGSMIRVEEGKKGVVTLSNGTEVFWARSGPTLIPELDDEGKPINARWDDRQLSVFWEVGRTGEGWALSPDREDIVFGSPFSYSITSNTLSLEELIAIAESVSFDRSRFHD